MAAPVALAEAKQTVTAVPATAAGASAGADLAHPHVGAVRPAFGPAGRKAVAWAAVKAHKVLAVTLALALVGAVAVAAALLIRQDVGVSSSAVAPDVVFEQGTGYAAINAAGFATLTVGSSGASATLSLSGVPGAALTTLTNVAAITNQDATQAYTVSLARSAAPNAAITGFSVVVKEGATTLETWNAATTATSSSFTLDAATSLDLSISLTVTDGTAAGSLGSFTIQVSLVPA